MKIKSYSTHLPTLLLLLILTLTTPSSPRQIQIPTIKQPTQRSIKLGRLQQVRQPNYNFQYVQSRQVYKADNQMSPFPPCHQNKPQVSFTITDHVIFENHGSKPIVLYKFQDVQFSQFLLDAYIDDSNIVYMIFQDGKAATVQIDQNQNTKNFKLHNITNLDQNTKLQPGYFLQLGTNIIFVNNKYAIKVTTNSATKLDGYTGGINFVTAIAVDGLYVAVGYEEFGVVFYWYSKDQGKLEEFSYLPPSEISSKKAIQIADLAYYAKERSLFVLDQDQGILTFNLQNLTQKQIKISPGNILFKRQACSMMNLNQKTIHIVCNEIYQLNLEAWPRIQQKTLPHPNLKIRQIYVEGPLVAFVGRNIFKLMYLGRLVNYFQDQKMDKLIFKKDMFVSANQGGLLIGRYEIIQPYITCQTVYNEMIGTHALIFKTVAECSQDFLKQYDIKLNSLNSFTPQDTCIYTVQRSLYFWRTGQIMFLPIIIILILLIVIMFGVILVWFMKKLTINKFQKQLEEYTSLTTSQNPKHQQLVQQQPEFSGNNKSGASNNLENQDDVQNERNVKKKNPSDQEIQVEMQNHDIE